ncbi:GNAT family N-acetyltransferase [Aquisalibacillus elongatus]|uniref:GNAT acetyltransferase-like protein n=1 Tax=Aquisalibacillus elongatus TaxID=485577 RepID=A0A3N5AZD7_9BACI|nr:GNAT family N-acetyltransferase [Aquisalibacillus elongatus]RPF50309.1 GNAT acetyltransferase-like protein [Aquisalibacillus elongatus]
MIYKADNKLRKKLLPMFEEFDSTVVLSCLQGHMGTAWVDDLNKPTVAQLIVGIFVFYAGNSKAKESDELLYNLPDFTLAIANTEEWKEKIESVHKGYFEKFQRFEFHKNSSHLNKADLNEYLKQIPEGYKLVQIDSQIAKDPTLHGLSEDFISQFNSVNDFVKRGIGFAILKEGEIVCGATSYSIFDDGIEIEIATHPNHRRKGLATIAASALIKECLNRDLYPSWDGANFESARLAEKLGYQLKTTYDTYFIE